MNKRARTTPAVASPLVATMGEAMLRYQPIDEAPPSSAVRHMPQPFLRSLGGDELNVAVALSGVGVKTKWISVLPTGPMGDVVTESCSAHGVEFGGTRYEGDLGTFTVLPEKKTVHYQRRHSAFALHSPASLDWPKLLASSTWLHLTGITPLVSASARRSWDGALAAAQAAKLPVSLDLNHRPQLGSLEALWDIVAPHAAHFELIILSLDQLQGLVQLQCPQRGPPPDASSSDEECLGHMEALHRGWKCRRVALCRKTRDPSGVQRRWSLLTSFEDGEIGTASTHDVPVFHVPKDECGGGSAWAAGIIHSLHVTPAGSV